MLPRCWSIVCTSWYMISISPKDSFPCFSHCEVFSLKEDSISYWYLASAWERFRTGKSCFPFISSAFKPKLMFSSPRKGRVIHLFIPLHFNFRRCSNLIGISLSTPDHIWWKGTEVPCPSPEGENQMDCILPGWISLVKKQQEGAQKTCGWLERHEAALGGECLIHQDNYFNEPK